MLNEPVNYTLRGSGSHASYARCPNAARSQSPNKPPVPARADAIPVLKRQHQALLAKAAAIDRAIRAQQLANANAAAQSNELVITPPPRGSSKRPAAPEPLTPAADRWSRVVPPDTALTFAAVWDPKDGMVTFSKPRLQDSPPQTSRPPCIRPGEYSTPDIQGVHPNYNVASPSVPHDVDAKSTVLSIDLLAAALAPSGSDGALPSASFPKDIDARSAVLTIDLLAAALTTPGPASTSFEKGLNTARLALDADINARGRGAPMNFACEALDDLTAYLDAFFPAGVPPAAPTDNDGTSSVGLEAWVRKSLLPKLAETGEDYQFDWSALDDMERTLIHDPQSAFVDEWKGAKSAAEWATQNAETGKPQYRVLVRETSAGSSGSKSSNGKRSVEDEGFYELLRPPSSIPRYGRQAVAQSIVDEEPNLPSHFSTTTTSTSNYIQVGFPTPSPGPYAAFRLPLGKDVTSDSASDIERDRAVMASNQWPTHYAPEPPVPSRSQSSGPHQTPSKRRLYNFARSASETTTPPRVRPSSSSRTASPPCLTRSGYTSPASPDSPQTPSSAHSPVSPLEVLSRPTYNHTSLVTPPTPLYAHYAQFAPSQKPISAPMSLLPAGVSQIPSAPTMRRKTSTASFGSMSAKKLIKGKFGSIRNKMRPIAFEEEGDGDDDEGWVGVTVQA